MIYLDNNATTPLDPEVARVYTESLENFGNPSSIHGLGRTARLALNQSREKIANLLGVKDSSLTFTSGGTEALNTALLGVFLPEPRGKHLILSAVEHPSVLRTARFLQSQGVALSVLPVDARGRLDPSDLKKALRDQTQLVAVMAANNETGNIHPIEKLGEITREHGAYFLCDAVQAMGKLRWDWGRLPVDFLAASAHKFHGPKGIGFLYTREGISWEPWLHGGRQERAKRAGTENLPAIVAMAQALCQAQSYIKDKPDHLGQCRDRLEAGVQEAFPDVQILGDPQNRLANTLNFHIPGVSGDSALMNLDLAGVAISIGAACESGSVEPSHVLQAMGLPDSVASSGLRFSLSRFNTLTEIEEAILILKEVVSRIRRAA